MAITFTRKTWVDYQEGPYLEASELNRFESALDALVNGTSRAVRLDGDTMTGGLTLSAGNLNVGAGDIRTAGTSRISNTGRFDATSIYNTALTSGRVVRVGAGGQLVDDAGLTTTQSSGKTLTLLIGDGSADTASPALTLDGYSGSSYPAVNFRSVGNTRTTLRWENSEDRFAVVMRNDDGSARNTPIFIPRTSATSMEFGGAELQPATFKGTVTVNGGLADGQMVHSGANGLLRSDAGLTYSRVSSITRRVIVGDGSVGSHTTVALRRSAGYRTAYEFLTEDGVTRWGARMSAVSTDYQIVAQDASGNDIDVPVAIPNAAGSAIVLGGSGGTTRDVNLTKDLLLSGARRISAAGAVTATSLSSTDQAGTGERLVSASAAGAQSATTAISAFAKTILDDADAATFRATIGVDGLGGITQVQDALRAPPGSPVTGVPYLTGSGSTGAWAGQDYKLATWDGSAWIFASRPMYALCMTADGILCNVVDGNGVRIVYAQTFVASGTMDASAFYSSGVRVVNGRKTGWAAATGTPTRTTFATGSVTLEQLAERVKALIDDLTAHGLIGA